MYFIKFRTKPQDAIGDLRALQFAKTGGSPGRFYQIEDVNTYISRWGCERGDRLTEHVFCMSTAHLFKFDRHY